MLRRRILMALALALGFLFLAESATPARAQEYNLNPFWYYPYYYFPQNFWPVMGPKYPEPPGTPYRPPPAYMTYPAFREPNWHYDLWSRMPYYRGSHFWLDQF
jgi:hypothetical protein